MADGPTSDSTPLQFLSSFVDANFGTNLIEKTNVRAQQVKGHNPNANFGKSNQDVSIEEMKAFVGIRMYRETVLTKLCYRDYWKGDGTDFLGFTPGFRNFMTRQSFLALWSFLHLVVFIQ